MNCYLFHSREPKLPGVSLSQSSLAMQFSECKPIDDWRITIDEYPAVFLNRQSTINIRQSLDRFYGGLSEGETPVPIPNTAVKPLSADDTAWATGWESRPPP